jgi:membrane protein implicated in regulation of membrane protease activity
VKIISFSLAIIVWGFTYNGLYAIIVAVNQDEDDTKTTGKGKLSKRDPARWHTIYSFVSTAVEEAAIAALILWILPVFGIVLPAWALCLALVVFAIYSYIMYRIGHPTISYKKVNAPESIVGSTGMVEKALTPDGFVRVRGELWKARSDDGNLAKDQEVTVSGIDGLKLTVNKKSIDQQ